MKRSEFVVGQFLTNDLAWVNLLSACGFQLVRRGYYDFQKAGNNCGLLHSCGQVYIAQPLNCFWQHRITIKATPLHFSTSLNSQKQM